MSAFVHLHLHTTYSLLDGATQISRLVARAKKLEMPAVAITDHGNLFGAKEFYDSCRKAKIKPIIGCEAYVAKDDIANKTKENMSGDHLVLLAKNFEGYRNLVRLVSTAHIDGFYMRPRIDKSLVEKHHAGLVATSACMAGEIPQFILGGKIAEAEAAALWYKNLFGEDFYLEISAHPADLSNGMPSEHLAEINREVFDRQNVVNKEIIALGARLGIKVVASNDVHFLDKDDAEAHDILLCVSTGKKANDSGRLRYTRQEWFKSDDEMAALFPENPETLANTLEIAEKIEAYELDSDPIMPVFPIPADFPEQAADETALREEFGEAFDKLGGFEKVRRIKFEYDYLRKLTLEGAALRYPGGVPPEYEERIDFELSVIRRMGFPGYFLIVQDFIAEARRQGVLVGPGRGSAAGSMVAYCLRITNVDPMKYDLLFERFLNPDRISMPDMDIDFDDRGRDGVLKWVAEKYGADRVAHIATYGTMAPKNAIKDVCRALDVAIPEANRLAGLVPNAPGMDFPKALKGSPELNHEFERGSDITRRILSLASALDGTTRNKGVHACGVIIARDPLIETVPVMPTEDDQLLTTQYDGHFVEPIGLLKMDFLGLRTLTVFKDCLANIKTVRGIDLDLDEIPFDDAETYELFGRGDTIGTFQFESEGMRKYLKELQPNRLGDLVAMNALYRPGPMEYIPRFIARKHGREKIAYDHPLMEKYLKETYGVTVYQEQVMLLSRELANFTRGESDTLRKAMGKKQKDVMDKLKAKFIEGCLANPAFVEGVPKNAAPVKLIDKIWADWEAFASYAFNKSHSVGYAIIAYQTGYLKTHYTPEFMSALITSEMGNADKMPLFLNEAAQMGYKILPPDVNHSNPIFAPETLPDGKTIGMRYGLAGIKGVGFAASQSLADERAAGGPYKGYMDFIGRQGVSSNKKTFESLILAGALDCFGYHRAAMLEDLPSAMKRAAKAQEDKASGQISLFGAFGGDVSDDDPGFHDAEINVMHDTLPPMPLLELLEKEKEVVGMFVSGHPVSKYRYLARACTSVEEVNAKLAALNEKLAAAKVAFTGEGVAAEGGRGGGDWKSRKKRGEPVRLCGLVSDAQYKLQKDGKRMLAFTLEDESAKTRIVIFGRDLERLATDRENPHAEIAKNQLLLVNAEIGENFRGEEAQLTVQNHMPLNDAARLVRTVMITCEEAFFNERGPELRGVLSAHPGAVPVTITLRLRDKTRVRIACGESLGVLPDESFAAGIETLLGANKLAVAFR